MDGSFCIGQIFWIAFLVCGVYLSFAFWRLADEETARTATPAVPTATGAGAWQAGNRIGASDATQQFTIGSGRVNIPHADAATIRLNTRVAGL
jgi:hypothetical protein